MSGEVDFEVLHRFCSADGKTLPALLKLFIKSADDCLREMLQAVVRRDLARLPALGHKLKSGARWVGAMRMGKLCEAIEACGQDQNQLAVMNLLDELNQCYARVCEELNAEIDRLDCRTCVEQGNYRASSAV